MTIMTSEDKFIFLFYPKRSFWHLGLENLASTSDFLTLPILTILAAKVKKKYTILLKKKKIVLENIILGKITWKLKLAIKDTS